jgi:hypothetical protein
MAVPGPIIFVSAELCPIEVGLLSQSVGPGQHADDGRQQRGRSPFDNASMVMSATMFLSVIGRGAVRPCCRRHGRDAIHHCVLLATVHGHCCWGRGVRLRFLWRAQSSRLLVAPRYKSHYFHSCARHENSFFLDIRKVDPSSLLRGSD